MIEIRQITSKMADEVFTDKELLQRVCFDGADTVCLPGDDFYLGCYLDGELCGFFWLHADTGSAGAIHINIKKDYRSLAFEFVKELYRLLMTMDVVKWNTKIPECYPEVYMFAKRCGFKDEGLDRKSIEKGGWILDRYILGITKQEIAEWVELAAS